jgi:ATP-binding cassette subfamily C protein CydD
MSFLSGFVLELVASLSVAVIAVTIGLRLLGGSLDLSVGLFVLLLAPEAFLPLRNVGASYHAATEGMEAADRAFSVIEAADGVVGPTAAPGATSASDTTGGGLVFEDVSVAYDGRTIVDGFTAEVPPGELAVLRAPSGAGKSSLIGAALGFVPAEGRILAGGRADAEGRRGAIAWAGQRPGLIAGSIAANVALGDPAPDAAVVAGALRDAAAPELDPATELGAGGAGLSGGQAQRVAVARALYRLRTRGCPVLVLDEPTSALDAGTERRLLESLHQVAAQGTAVLVVSHREAAAEAADRVIAVEAGEVSRVR